VVGRTVGRTDGLNVGDEVVGLPLGVLVGDTVGLVDGEKLGR
jgi:hypothetical protein